MNLYINTSADEDINPREEAELRRFVALTTVACPLTAIQTAVTTAAMLWQQDWSQEGRKVMRELGIAAAPSLMYATA